MITKLNAMKVIMPILFIAVCCSCNNYLNKTIFEPLTVAEIKKAVEKDSSFAKNYEVIKYIRDSLLKTDTEKAKFYDLTYKKVHKFINYATDSNYFKPLIEGYKEEWGKKYGVLHKKVDSISDYWKKYKAENSLDQYIEVELADIDKEYFEYIGGVRSVNLGFRLTPKKGTIEQVRFGYKIEAKIHQSEEESSYSSFSFFDKSWCLSTTPISQSTVRYWKANYTNEKILKNKTVTSFLRDYDIFIEIELIRKDGKNMSNDDLGIPESIISHWKYEKNIPLKDLYVKDVLEEVMGIEYLSEDDYILKQKYENLRKKDSVIFEFIIIPMNSFIMKNI